MRKTSSRAVAFTLVELLVVIGIIALLISILMPTLSRAKEHANRTKCLANMKQIGLASIMYCNDNKGFMMWRFRTVSGVTDVTRTYGSDVGSGSAGVQNLLPLPYGNGKSAYLKTPEVFFCPADFVRRPYRKQAKDPVSGVMVLTWGPTGYGSTGINSMSYFAYYIPAINFTGGSPLYVPQDPEIVNDRFGTKKASEKAWLADQGFMGGSVTEATGIAPVQLPFFHGTNDETKGWNVLYLDGHAKWIRANDLRPYLQFYTPTSPYNTFQEGSIRGYNKLY